jgi:hypothetical protein
MAEDEQAAGAEGRLEQALDRIARAGGERLRDAQEAQQKVDTVAERLDALIAELRAALRQSTDDTKG